MSTAGIVFLVIGGVILILIIALISMYNTFIRQKNKVDEAFSTMDVFLKKRYDLIPNIVETVKGYAKHEQSTLEKVIALRNTAAKAASEEDKIEANAKLTAGIRSIFALAENYPDLKANTNFIELQNSLKSIESEIASSRKYYNATVRDFNTKCEAFPSNIIAKWFKFQKRQLYVVDDDVERKNVKVEF